MARQMKYIVVDCLYHDGRMLDDVPLVFPDYLNHSEVARSLGSNSTISSAGQCVLVDVEIHPRDPSKPLPFMVAEKDIQLGVRWQCFGESTSLKIQSNPERDEQLLDRQYR